MKSCTININDEKLRRTVEIVTKRLFHRGIVEGDDLILNLKLDNNLLKDTYKITGNKSNITITADSVINIVAGCGSFLRNSTYNEDGIVPSEKRGSVTPDHEYRGVYFANHFHNFYQTAPDEEMNEYIEDLALWGFNNLKMIFPKINMKSRSDSESTFHLDRLAKVLRFAKETGFFISVSVSTSDTFIDYPHEFKATPVVDPLGVHGNSGNILCMSKPEAQEYINEENRYLLGELKERGILLDYVFTWPYDEGGCGCPDCSPWGGNGYIKAAKQAVKIAKEFNPDCKVIVSTWTFDTPYQGEWEALSKSLENEKWCDMILADAHNDYPRYPLDCKVPGNLPLISFPEISMWGLYPWGGYGASFFPSRMTSIWRQTEGKLCGEMLYSEGIFEDINKIIVAGLCEDFNREPSVTLAQYARYELGCPNTEKFVRLVNLVEQNHILYENDTKSVNTKWSDEAYALSNEINAELPQWGKKSWRWRIIMLRVILDWRRYKGEDICSFDDTLSAMHEIIDIFHCLKNDTGADPYHVRVRPICPMYNEKQETDIC